MTAGDEEFGKYPAYIGVTITLCIIGMYNLVNFVHSNRPKNGNLM